MSEYERNPNPRGHTERRRGWGLPIAVAAFVLVIAAIIFSAAGPDRTRTTEFNSPNSDRIPATQAQPAESGIPPSGQDAQTPAQVAPQKSNPAGTQ